MEPTDIIRENRSVREYKNKKISELKKEIDNLKEIIYCVNFTADIYIDRCSEPGCNVFSIDNRGSYEDHNGELFSCEASDSETYCTNHMNGKLFTSIDRIYCKNCIN